MSSNQKLNTITISTLATINTKRTRIIVELLHKPKRTSLSETEQIPLAENKHMRTVHLNIQSGLAHIVRIVGHNALSATATRQHVIFFLVAFRLRRAAEFRGKRKRLILVGLEMPRRAHRHEAIRTRHIAKRTRD